MENTDKYKQLRYFNFTGKERDSETGFSYFGARYYDSDLSGLFLSVDPMAEVSSFEKRSGLLRTSSSLRAPQELVPYCAWNPIVYIDSNGMEITDWPKIGRCAKGAMNIVSGTITAIGGIVIRAGVSVFTGGVAAPIGAIVVGTGAYEITEGIHNIANALSGAPKSSDPKYTTPIGAVTNITTADFVTSVLVGYGSTAVTALGKATTATSTEVRTSQQGVKTSAEGASGSRANTVISTMVTTADVATSTASSSAILVT